MQRNWIGRSDGAEIELRVAGRSDGLALKVFTTRPDTGLRDDLRGDGAGAPVGRRADDAREQGGRRRDQAVGRVRDRSRADGFGLRRPCSRQARCVHRQLRGQPVQRRTDPVVRRRLRDHALRDRGDHGRARRGPARLGLRQGLRPSVRADRRARTAASTARRGQATARRSTPASWTGSTSPRRSSRAIEWLVEQGIGTANAELPSPRLARSRGSATGVARSRSSTAVAAASSACPKTSFRFSLPTTSSS